MKVIALRGEMGSGKSTYRAVHFPLAPVCSADHKFEELDTDPESPTYGKIVYKFNPALLPEAHGDCLRKFVNIISNPYAAEDGIDEVVVDNTNATIAEIAPYAALALAYGHELQIITLIGDPVVHHARNVHGVPLETVRRVASLIDQESERFPPWWPHKRIVTFNGVTTES